MYKVKKGLYLLRFWRGAAHENSIILLYYKLLYKNNSIYKGGIFTYSDK